MEDTEMQFGNPKRNKKAKSNISAMILLLLCLDQKTIVIAFLVKRKRKLSTRLPKLSIIDVYYSRQQKV